MGGSSEISFLAVLFKTCTCTALFTCNTALDSSVGILLWILLMLYMFKSLGTVCDEYFVPALEAIVEKLGMPEDIAGATFMASGSSAPELFTSLVATFVLVSEGGVGTIVGSAIFNILIIVGATGIVACKDQVLNIWWYPLTRDAIWYSVAVGELALVLADSRVTLWEAIVMFLTYVAYCGFMVINPWIVSRFRLQAEQKELEVSPGSPTNSAAGAACQVSTEADGLRSLADAYGQPRPAPDRFGFPSSGGEETTPNECDVSKLSEGDKVVLTAMTEPAPIPPGALDDGANGAAIQVGCKVKAFHSGEWFSGTVVGVPAGQGPRQVKCEGEKEPTIKMCTSVRTAGRSETVVISNPPSTCSGAASPSGDGGANGKCLDKESDAGASVFDRWPLSLLRDPLTLLWQYTMPDPEKYCWPLFAASILWIALCTYLMVDATARIGEILRIPTYVMGLLFLAAGTSIPDAMGSIAVAKDGKGDMAIANALGSNIFDILLGLGLPWCIQCLRSGEDIVFENVFDTLKVDLMLLYGVLAIFVGSLALNRWRLNRKIGCVLCMFYGCFAVFVILDVYVFKSRAS